MAGWWIGVDLDGTLAEWREPAHGWDIGPPVPEMVAVVRRHLAEGHEVRVFTARVDGGRVALALGDRRGEQYRDVKRMRRTIRAWCLEHVGQELEATNVKDYGMALLYDDRCVRVKANTGAHDRDAAAEILGMLGVRP